MLRKIFVQIAVLGLVMLSVFGTPLEVRAGGVCGGTWVAEAGDTVEKLAALCGTSTAAIYAANPGISNTLKAGQVLTIPGLASAAPTDGYDPSYYYDHYYYQPSTSNATTYIVQYGDTFAKIASRYGISLNELWGANPQIWDIDILYTGQAIYIPAAYSPAKPPASATKEPTALTYPGDIPRNASQGTVKLVNKSNGDVYVSLRIARADGTNAIYEYPVKGTMYVEIPIGWIDYIASVGGVKFTGGFKLKEGAISSVTFYRSKVVLGNN